MEAAKRQSLRIQLTEQQKETLRELGLEAFDYVEVTAKQLEDRIAPSLTSN